MKIAQKINFLGCMCGLSFALMPSPVDAWTVNAYEIYNQAKQENYNYLNILKRYNGAIDVKDSQGNTAYCLAIKYKDTSTQRVLADMGADTRSSCVKQVQNEEKQKKKRAYKKEKKSVFRENNDNSYWKYGLGALVIGGGVAALAGSGGGGGGSHVSGEINGPGGGDNPVTPPVKPDNPDDLKRPSAESFRTKEYNHGNYLEAIHAAEAYTYMYSQDANGNMFSHQANSHDALKKVQVGVIDTGVNVRHFDLQNKIKKGYDLNRYNDLGNVRGCVKNNSEYYVIENNNKYYMLILKENAQGGVNALVDKADNKSKLAQMLKKHELTEADLSVMNGGDGVNPGTGLIQGFKPLPDNASYDELMEVVENWVGITSNLNHGSHIAGIIAANKNNSGNHGVAFENTELVFGSWDLGTGIYSTVKKMTDDGISVLSNSWGTPTDLGLDAADKVAVERNQDENIRAFAYLAKNKGVWVHAAGNEGYNEPVEEAGIGGLSNEVYQKYGYAGAGQYEAPFLTVVALDPKTKDSQATSGYLAEFSNKCGSASGYCIAAPGSDINSTGAFESGTISSSGTSMAAPVVTGSISLLMGYYPWLTAQNVSYLLLETANKNGAYADNLTYGQGALDLNAAVTTPIGELGLPTTANVDGVMPARVSKVSLSGIVQNKMLKALPEKITAFDALKRPFEYDTAKMVNTTHASNANLRNEVARIALGNNKNVIKGNNKGLSFATTEAADKSGRANLTTAEVINETDTNTSRFYYAENSKYAEAENVLAPSSNPYLAMNEAYGAENTLKLSDTSKLKLSLQTGENGLYERDYEQDNHTFKERSYAFSGEYSFNLTNYLEMAAVGGMLFEDDALLGLNGSGLMGIEDTSTYFMGIKAIFNVTDNVSLLAAYYRGYTQGSDASMLSVSDLQTESFMLAGEYKVSPKNKFGISIASPLQVVKGHAGLSYAIGRDNNSSKVYMKHLKASLRPEAKEYDMGFYYQGQPNDNLGVTGKVQARFNADGEKGETDYIGILGAQYSF